ncbi:hypothetical protein WJX73_009168 [Symbiochloris irregularis]|uniref:STAS domain-containing protein n=1 Tax=Symbiochloris irregularis TaxID=706552 RepID=A0AAW1NXT3_9CHLO
MAYPVHSFDGFSGDHLSGPRQRDNRDTDIDRLARTQSVKDQSQSLLSDDGLRSSYRPLKVEYPDKDDTQLWVSDIEGWWQKQRRKSAHKFRTYTWWNWLCTILPMFEWLRGYNIRQDFLYDLLAGTSVAALVVPQGMSYAKSAGLPSVYGLYGAFVPVMVYAGLGSSRHLAVGPVAVTSLLLGNGLPDAIDAPVQSDPNNPHNQFAQDQYNKAAIEVAFLVGILYTAVGFLRLAWLTNFISHSVISGFMTGAAVTIALQQVKFIFGYNSRPNPDNTPYLTLPSISFPRHSPIQEQLGDLLGGTWTPYFAWREFVMGVSWLILLFAMRYFGQKYKKLLILRAIGPLTVTILSIAIVNIWHLQRAPQNIRVVGTIPKGLPGASWGWFFPMEHFGKKLGLAIVVCLIDVLESISIAKALAYKNKYILNPTRELRALGIANIVGACFTCYTNTGSFSRSAVMDQVGSRTQLAGFVGAIWVMIVLLVLTPVFKNMPQNAQGAIIIVAVSGLVNYSEWWYLWKVNKFDWLVFNGAFLGVIFAGVDIGLAIGIGMSIIIALWHTAFPKTVALGQLPSTHVYRNVNQYPEAETVDGMLLLRIDSPLYFANVNPVREGLARHEAKALRAAAANGQTIDFIIIDLAPVIDVDASAIHFFTDWIADHKDRGIQPVLANPSPLVVRQLEAAGVPKQLGREFVVGRMHDAVTLCRNLQVERGLNKSSGSDQKPVIIPDQLVTPPADNLSAGFDDEHVQENLHKPGGSLGRTVAEPLRNIPILKKFVNRGDETVRARSPKKR